MEGLQLTQGLKLDLLQMKEITTKRQQKNGTRIFQYKLENGDGEYGYGDDYARYLTDKGHNIGNIQWMVHDIKEFVDHTIKSTIEKDT